MNAKNLGLRCCAVSALAIVAGAALAQQDIGVYVNNDRVPFKDVPPQIIDGRVLVPVRGVLEQLGAYVDYDARTDVVTATRGDLDIRLQIGDRTAMVDGQRVTLDVPAQVVRGRTLVPLRFMSEALGAEVRWDPGQYAVLINTGNTGGGAAQPLPEQYEDRDVRISAFDVSETGWLEPGQQVTFTLRGTPGGNAALLIPALDREIEMREVSSGVYRTTWTVPRDTRITNASQLNAIARLRVGRTERLIQSNANFSIDTRAPEITGLTPDPDTRVSSSRPNISAVFDDMAGSGVDTRSVVLRVDGRDVTNEANVTSNFISWRPDEALRSGEHVVSLTARDLAGNEVRREWRFRVDSAASDIIESFDVSGYENARPGDVITFTLRAEPRGRATYSIGNVVENRSMEEVSSGVYRGTYTVRRGDNFSNQPVTARFVTNNGQVYTIQGRDEIPVTGGPLEAPRITQPSGQSSVNTPLTVIGNAPANSRVLVRVEYATTVAGALRITGTIAEVVAETDDRGRFRTEPIKLDTLVRGSNTEYTITAYTLGSNNQRSDATSVTVRR